MKHFFLIVTATVALFFASGCGGPATGAYTGIGSALEKLERDSSGAVTATIRLNNPNVYSYAVSKSEHRITLDGASIGRVSIDKPAGLPMRDSIVQTAEVKLDSDGASRVNAAIGRGSAAYRIDSSLTILVVGTDYETIRSTAAGNVPVVAKP